MIQLRAADQRGYADHGWLKSHHTFSFAGYRDPAHVHFRGLRVINEDYVAAGKGFGTHPHDNMEIVTYVLSGALEHRDSMGNGEVLRPGEVQRMSAGTGITHSEFNPSKDESLHLYQIWLFPGERDIEPSYEQRPFDPQQRRDRWQLVIDPDRREDALGIHADVRLFLADVSKGGTLETALDPDRHAWVQILRGRGQLNGQPAEAGDGFALSQESRLTLWADQPLEVLRFDLA